MKTKTINPQYRKTRQHGYTVSRYRGKTTPPVCIALFTNHTAMVEYIQVLGGIADNFHVVSQTERKILVSYSKLNGIIKIENGKFVIVKG